MTTLKPINKVLLCVDKILNDEILTTGGIKLYLDPSWNPNWNASVTGVVAAIPVNSNKNINIGDEVAFSYTVISERTFNKIDHFAPMFEHQKLFKRFINGKGEKVTIAALPGAISKIWVGTYVDKYGQFIDGVQGSESDADRWLSQFNLSSNSDMRFCNLFNFNGKDYWMAEVDDIFAKRVKGKIVSLSDRMICIPIEEDVKAKIEIINGKPLPYRDVKMRYMDRGKVISGGEQIGIKEGQIVGFEERFMEAYEFWGKKYFLIKKDYVNAIWE